LSARGAVLALALSFAACAPPTGEQGRDLRLLEHMIRLNALHVGIEPHLRDTARYEELAGAAAEIERLAVDPVFVEWPRRKGFRHPPDLFDRYRVDLLEGARAASAALANGDRDGLHAAYAVMDASCIACHKRFSPLY
jgi:hypothetical protein